MSEQPSPIARFERVLLATDGSEHCAGAERVALDLAEKSAAVLQVMSVVVTDLAAEIAAIEIMGTPERDARALQDRLHTAAVARGIAVETIVHRGTGPYAEIVAAADEQRSDVIVMGRHGRPGLLARLIGDATADVLGKAKCSVLVVPDAADVWRTRILLATDGSRFSEAAAVAAARIAALYALPVTVLSTVRESFSAERAAAAEEAAARALDHFQKRSLAVDRIVLHGDPEELIPETAAAHGVDLIVMGTHGRTGWERVLVGSVAERVIGESSHPVLAVKT